MEVANYHNKASFHTSIFTVFLLLFLSIVSVALCIGILLFQQSIIIAFYYCDSIFVCFSIAVVVCCCSSLLFQCCFAEVVHCRKISLSQYYETSAVLYCSSLFDITMLYCCSVISSHKHAISSVYFCISELLKKYVAVPSYCFISLGLQQHDVVLLYCSRSLLLQ